LRAWGIRQNLFAEGQARITQDPQAVAAARAHPEVPLRRAVGSSEPFAVEPTTLPTVPDAPRRVAPAAARPKPSKAARPPADRAALDAAEAALQAIDHARQAEEAALRQRQEALDRDVAAAQAAYVAGRKAATATVVSARQAYCKGGANTERGVG
jgi:hypothetical protein